MAENKVWQLPVDENGMVTFPEEMLQNLSWRPGDALRWIDNGDGSWTLIKMPPSWTEQEEEVWQELELRQQLRDQGC
jgi:bifunctional DNA-binding transcriptional regulator/antitoxin component of YhaV-PrlF toxin-antitoxin module